MAQQHSKLMTSTCSESFSRINSSTPRPDDHISVSEALAADLPDGMFSLLDADSDQMLTRDEFSWCRAVLAQADSSRVYAVIYPVSPTMDISTRVCTYRFDLLNSQATVDDHIDVSEASRMPDGMFEALDTDNDRMVSRNEFKQCISKTSVDSDMKTKS